MTGQLGKRRQYIYKGEQVIKPENLSFVSDYKLNLLAPGHMTDEEIDRFNTSLREVLLFIKYSKDRARLNDMVQKDERFKHMGREAATVIKNVTGAVIKVDEEEDEVDMCQALREMAEDATNEGIQKGAQETAKRMLKEGGFSMELIARMANLFVDEVQALALETV